MNIEGYKKFDESICSRLDMVKFIYKDVYFMEYDVDSNMPQTMGKKLDVEDYSEFYPSY